MRCFIYNSENWNKATSRPKQKFCARQRRKGRWKRTRLRCMRQTSCKIAELWQVRPMLRNPWCDIYYESGVLHYRVCNAPFYITNSIATQAVLGTTLTWKLSTINLGQGISWTRTRFAWLWSQSRLRIETTCNSIGEWDHNRKKACKSDFCNEWECWRARFVLRGKTTMATACHCPLERLSRKC